METVITSGKNQYISKVRKLAAGKKYRQESGLFIIEGLRLVKEAVTAGVLFDFVLISSSLYNRSEVKEVEPLLENNSVNIFQVDHNVFSSVAQTENPQGILAVAKQLNYSWEDVVSRPEENFLLVIDSVQDPGNLGSIIRTADAAGVTGLLFTNGTVDVYNEKVVRSTMGSLFRIPFLTGCFPSELVEAFLTRKMNMLVADVSANIEYYNASFEYPLVIVLGNENRGPDAIFRNAGTAVRIPCRTESLNVSAAAAILLYERVCRNYQIR